MAEKGIRTQDWAAFRAQAQRMLDAALDQMQQAAERPWQPVPEDIDVRYAIRAEAQGPQETVDRIIADVLPYHGGNIHPRFWGWVQGSGLASDLISSVAAAALNANMGGRDHGANYMERAVVDWTRRKMGMPDGASGILVTGTSQATVIACQAARLRVMKDLRKEGQGAVRLTAYAGEGVHNATLKAVELLGIGSNNLRKVPLVDGQMDCAALVRMVAEDKAAGALPFLVVGTAGSVDLGLFDDLDGLADAAAALGLWLHVDGAFGAWTRIADEPYRSLSDGIGRADSIALDFHKWMYVGYDCGMALLRNEDEHRAAFAARPSYLEGAERGLAGGEPWFCDYGIDLSRGNRALKVWTALETYGEAAFSEAISGNCALAAAMAEEVEAQPLMALGAPVVSNVCVFTARSDLAPETQSQVNAEIAQTLQESGEAVFSTTRMDGRVMLRAAITNHRSRPADVKAAIAAVAREAARV
ncbi:pyridoxal phosphate-dependent decarboxylase family protein [Phaeobacter gallaeciensis]|uniref:pyridoxal phosphate-dependent decarboxylase family protein n=1 Tax=Phaeobacter gallaeciensis TaxID=60890 RepID=UPI000BBCD361|nr:pyridoxal-dependent decarboxylase [Phaeobacter gallaeciensis]ATF17839.1 putative L-2,4-diaminobutyrate decarboxylase [Phaeobacter gallaeciensis]ATF21948.1 putative L-2,4-diaminobutyrate decarboxylase [Phaeobacter gallaeciensis]